MVVDPPATRRVDLTRRGLLLGACIWPFDSKKKSARCELCGMTLDESSAWLAELTSADGKVHRFDAPRCALLAWRTGKVAAVTTRFQEYYRREWRDGTTLRFAVGSDVIGPMGRDAVPVAVDSATKFAADHGQPKILALDQLTLTVLQSL